MKWNEAMTNPLTEAEIAALRDPASADEETAWRIRHQGLLYQAQLEYPHGTFRYSPWYRTPAGDLLLATLDAERARREEIEAERDRLRAALAPLAAVDPQLFDGLDPAAQWLWKRSGGDQAGISVQHVLDARAAMERKTDA